MSTVETEADGAARRRPTWFWYAVVGAALVVVSTIRVLTAALGAGARTVTLPRGVEDVNALGQTSGGREAFRRVLFEARRQGGLAAEGLPRAA